MVAATNAVFLGVREAITAPDTGWTVRVLAQDFTTVLAQVHEFLDLTITVEINGPGAGSITLDLDTPMWTKELADGSAAQALREHEYVWEAYEDGVLRQQWLGTTCDETIITDSGTRAVVIAGPGVGNVLTWAKIFVPGYPDQPADVHWPWSKNSPAMSMFLYLLYAAQQRGTIPFVTPTFTPQADSAGTQWADVTHPYTAQVSYAPDLGSTLLDHLNDLTGQDLDKMVGMRAEWIMWPGCRLDVRPVIGSHREQQVIFYDGNVMSEQRSRTRETLANVVVIRDVVGHMNTAVDAASISRFGRREQFFNRSDLTDGNRRAAIARIMLQQLKDERSAWTIQIPYRATGRRVFRDFHVGDWIGVSKAVANTTAAVEPFRVMAISVQVPADAEPVVELTLHTLLDARIEELEKQLTRIVSTITNVRLIGNDPGPGDDDAPERPLNTNRDLPGGIGIGDWPATGGEGGCHVYIQAAEPTEASIGDFWYQP